MKNYLRFERLPKNIKDYIKEEELEKVYIGESLSEVIYIPNKKAYLKISPSVISYIPENELKIYKWLKGKLPVPEVLLYEKTKDFHYMVLSEIEGENIDQSNLSDEDRVTIFAEGLKRIHSIDISNCPVVYSTEDIIKRIKYSLESRVYKFSLNLERVFSKLDSLLEKEPLYEPVFIHGDFTMINVLVKDKKITGFIDMGEAGVYSKYKDIVHALLDLEYLGYSYYTNHFLKVYGIEPDEELMKFFIELDFD